MSTQTASPYRVSVMPIGDAAPDEITQICALKQEHWPHSLDDQLTWWHENSHQSDQLVRLYDGDDMIAFLRLRDRPMFIANAAVSALCATEICVRRAKKGRGIGRQLMKAAEAAIGTSHTSIGYLLCTDDEKAFYVKCGWQLANEVMLRRAENAPSRSLDKTTWCLLHDPKDNALGALVLQGEVF